MPSITVRFATADDVPLLLRLIRELAVFERAPDSVVATEADLLRHGFGAERSFEAILAFLDGEPAGARCSTRGFRPGSAVRACISKTSMSPSRRAATASANG